MTLFRDLELSSRTNGHGGLEPCPSSWHSPSQLKHPHPLKHQLKKPWKVGPKPANHVSHVPSLLAFDLSLVPEAQTVGVQGRSFHRFQYVSIVGF